MVNPIPRSQESKAYVPQTAAWKLEKKYWLIAIAVACLVLFWFGSSMLEVSLVKKAVELLPVLGGLCFAANSIIKLAQ